MNKKISVALITVLTLASIFVVVTESDSADALDVISLDTSDALVSTIAADEYEGKLLRLDTDQTITSLFIIPKSCSIDLNGHKIIYNGSIPVDPVLTLGPKDRAVQFELYDSVYESTGSTTGTIEIDQSIDVSTAKCALLACEGTVHMHHVCIDSDVRSLIRIRNTGQLTVDECKITGNGQWGGDNNMEKYSQGSRLFLTGNDSGDTLIINSGTYVSNYCIIEPGRGSTVIVNGGNYSLANAIKSSYNSPAAIVSGHNTIGNLTFNGGNFTLTDDQMFCKAQRYAGTATYGTLVLDGATITSDSSSDLIRINGSDTIVSVLSGSVTIRDPTEGEAGSFIYTQSEGGSIGTIASTATLNVSGEVVKATGPTTISGEVDAGTGLITSTAAITITNGGSLVAGQIDMTGNGSSISISSGCDVEVTKITTDQDSASISVVDGSVISVQEVKKVDSGGTELGDLTDETADSIINAGGSGSIGDNAVYSVIYLSYTSSTVGKITWQSNEASSPILTAQAVQAKNPAVELIPETDEFVGWTDTYGSKTISTEFVIGSSPANGNYQLFPVYKTKVTADSVAAIGGIPYQTIDDAIDFITAGETIVLTNDVSEAISIDATKKDWSLSVSDGVKYSNVITAKTAKGSASATFSDVIAGADGFSVKAGSVALSGSIKSGKVTTTTGLTEVASGSTLTLSKNASLSVGSGTTFENNGILYVYGTIEKTGTGQIVNNGKICLMGKSAVVADVDSGSDPAKYKEPVDNTSVSQNDEIVNILQSRQVTTTVQETKNDQTLDATIIAAAACAVAVAAALLAVNLRRS